jgi:hypothetical protein
VKEPLPTAVQAIGDMLALQAIVRILLINSARNGPEGLEAVKSWRAAIVGTFQSDFERGPLAGNQVVEAAMQKADAMFAEALHAADAVKRSGH